LRQVPGSSWNKCWAGENWTRTLTRGSAVQLNGFSREGNQKFASRGTEKLCCGDSASWAIWEEMES